VDGTCATCPEYQRGTPAGRSCAEPTCPAGESLLADGTCRRCALYTRPQGKYKCGADPCGANAVVREDGTCLPCPDFQKPDARGRACLTPSCTPGLRLNARAECEACPAYTRYGAVAGAPAFSQARPPPSAAAATHYILMLDRSGSMGGPGAATKWTALTRAVGEFFSRLATA